MKKTTQSEGIRLRGKIHILVWSIVVMMRKGVMKAVPRIMNSVMKVRDD